MRNSKWEIISLVLQGLYSAFCIADIVLCFIYLANFDNPSGLTCAELALGLTVVLLAVPAMPASLFLNIHGLKARGHSGSPRSWWLAWTIMSPFVYIVFWLAACFTLVATTGGV